LKIIKIQKILYDEVLYIIEILLSLVTENVSIIKGLWESFAESLQQSIEKHLNTISKATETNYGKYSLLVKIEIVDFDMIMLKYPYKKNFISKTRIMKQCEGIKRKIKDISKSYSSINVEEEFKNDIEKLWEKYDEVEKYAENLEY
jgi:hypothetical protein